MGAYSLAAATETERVEPQGPPAAAQAVGAFEALSQWLMHRPLPSSALVSGTDLSVFAIADHVVRCLSGLRVARGAGALGVEGFIDLQRAMSESLSNEGPRSIRASEGTVRISPVELASKLRALAEQTDCHCLLVVDSVVSTFGRQVFAEVAKLGTPVVWVVGSAVAHHQASFVHFELPATLEAAEVARWWSLAAKGAASQIAEGSIEQLEMWWRRSARGLARAFVHPHNELAARLRLIGRAVPLHLLSGLLGAEAVSNLDELEQDPSIDRVGSWFFARPVAQVEPMSAEARDAAVLVLERLASSGAALDAWALLRAAELAYAVPTEAVAVDATSSARGDQLALRAVSSAPDAAARGEFWQRVLQAMPAVAGEGPLRAARIALLPSWVEFALTAGDADVALRLARQLCELDGGSDRPQHVLLLGRALSATGDLSAATGLLERVANDLSVGLASRARAAVELAEARYFSNDLAGAAEAATVAATSAEAATESGLARSLFLDARNVQGKLLLASGDFENAERHFVTDACDAAILGERSLELRARANRAIAVMSQGRRSEAQSMLEAILHDAEELGELRAIGIALINLAPLAIFDHRYMDALELSERSVEVLRRIGDKVRLARVVANLAELRLRLGLVDEAAHAIRFALPVFRGGPPAERVWHSSLLLGRVALAKGDTASAQRHVNDALAAVGAGSVLRLPPGDPSLANVARGPVHSRICDALLVGARAALEDGDVVRAELYVSRADTDRVPPRSAASVLLCRALLARAKGEEFLPTATAALQAARELDDDELLIEAHLLLHQGHVLTGARSSAKHHLLSALATRDRVSDPLSPELRTAFLSRRDLLELARAQQTFEGDEALSWDAPSSRGQGLSAASASSSGSFRAEARVPESAREPGMFVGSHPTMKALQNAVRKVGSSDSTVLIHGESGTGKELVAEALHQCSHRAKGPLVKVNCAALVETLLLSELFGYEKGAFTGAASRRRGRFEAAEGGTLFLDEIGDISARTQVALLRVLQEKTFERVGGNTSVRADVRIVCATHRDLKALVEAGQFREDLYYRLCGIVLQVPALRKRRSDIGALSSILLARIAEERGGAVKKLSQRALLALGTHTWPGNVRELENALRAASVFAEGQEIELEDFAENVESLRHLADSSFELASAPGAPKVQELPRALSSAPATPPASLVVGADVAPSQGVNAAPSSLSQSSAPAEVAYAAVRGGISLHDIKRTIERDCIARALSETNGNITRAAAVLGMKRPRLSQLVKQYELGAQLDGAPASDDFDSAAAEEE